MTVGDAIRAAVQDGLGDEPLTRDALASSVGRVRGDRTFRVVVKGLLDADLVADTDGGLIRGKAFADPFAANADVCDSCGAFLRAFGGRAYCFDC